MTLTQQTAKHLRDIHFGGNWTTTNLKDVLSDVSWKEATTQIDEFNTIAVLTYHTTYYINALLDVLEGKALTSKDELSFLCPQLSSEFEWQNIQRSAWDNVEKAAVLIEGFSDEKLKEDFTDEKYGSYYRNIHGIIEHMHYHLGQIVILKRLVRKLNEEE
jgi:hypothetical protein